MPQMGSIAMMKGTFRRADAVTRQIVPADHDRKDGAMTLILPAKLKAERNPSAINRQRESKKTRLSAEGTFRRESAMSRGSQALRRFLNVRAATSLRLVATLQSFDAAFLNASTAALVVGTALFCRLAAAKLCIGGTAG
jgi:hypothetical protein